MLICEIGCGNKREFNNSISVDIRPLPAVSVVADASFLPFKSDSFDMVYSSHVIEHFSHIESDNLLKEWIRILKVGGTLEIRCPDLRARAFIFSIFPNQKNIQNIYGNQEYEFNFHKNGFSYGILKKKLQDNQIINIKRIRDNPYNIPLLPSDLHITGMKN
jgi:SAM-dependent methyltransferase